MSQSMADIFKLIGSREVTERGEYFEPGDYRVVHWKVTIEPKDAGLMFVAEHVIEIARKTESLEPARIGTKRNLVRNLTHSKKSVREAGYDDVKKYILAIFGKTSAEVSASDIESTLKEMAGDEFRAAQPLRGKVLDCKWKTKPKKNTPGETIVVGDWYHVPQTDEEVKAKRAAVEKAR